jgi:hypothetical protein
VPWHAFGHRRSSMRLRRAVASASRLDRRKMDRLWESEP